MLPAASSTSSSGPIRSRALFGFHEVFHAFVIAAATCHYLAVFDTITRHINS